MRVAPVIASTPLPAPPKPRMDDSGAMESLPDLPKRLRLLEAAVRASEILLQSNVGDAAAQVLELITRAFDCDRGAIARILPPDTNSEIGYWQLHYEWVVPGLSRQSDDPRLRTLNLNHYPDTWALMCANRTWQFATDELTGQAREEQEACGAVSQFGTNIRIDGKLWGALCFDDCRRRRIWDQAEIGLLEILGSAVASTVRREQLLEAKIAAERQAAEERTAELARANRVLASINRQLAEAANYEATLRFIVAEISAAASARSTRVYGVKETSGRLELLCAFEDGQVQDTSPAPSYEAPDGNGTFASSVEWPEILAGNDSRRILLADSPPGLGLDWHRRRGEAQVLLTPLVAGDAAIGLMCVGFLDSAPLTEGRRELIHALAQQVTLALQFVRFAKDNEVSSTMAAISEERGRIARDLHDSVAHGLTGILMQVQAARLASAGDTSMLQSCLVHIEQSARRTLQETRATVAALEFAEDYGDLTARMRELVSSIKDCAVRMDFRTEGEATRVPPHVGLHLLRIAQEAFTNALRYASAKELTVSVLITASEAVLIVGDDGVGFATEGRHEGIGSGIEGMKKRALRMGAHFELYSRPGEGTRIGVWAPLTPRDERKQAETVGPPAV